MMKQRVGLSASFMIILLLASVVRPSDKDLGKSLIGKWKLVSAENRNQRIPQADIDDAKIYIEITRDTVTFYEKYKKKKVLKYKIKTEKTPHELQFLYDNGMINYAIVTIKNGKLMICSSNKYRPNSPEEQPDGFDVMSKKNAKLGGLYLEVYSLEK